MKAAVITRPGGPEVLEVREVARPEPQAQEVLVRVRAAGLNRADLLQRQGRYPAPAGVAADIPGLEFAGEVAGAQAGRWREGQRVFGIVAGGAHAEYVVTHQDMLVEVPAGMDWVTAAAAPEVYITAHDALRQAGLRKGESVLVHAVGSGVGVAAVQLARAMGAVPYGTSRTADKLERARAHGMEDGFVAASLDGLVDWALRATGGRGFDVVLDLVGGPYVGASLGAMALKGRLMMIATAGGRKAEVDLGMALSKRVTLKGTVLRSRPVEEKIEVTRAFAEEVAPLLAAGRLKPVVDAVFPLDKVQEAHRRLESNQTFGKVVLKV